MFVFWSQSPIFDKESSKILQIELIIICFKIFIWQAIVDALRFYGGLFFAAVRWGKNELIVPTPFAEILTSCHKKFFLYQHDCTLFSIIMAATFGDQQ